MNLVTYLIGALVGIVVHTVFSALTSTAETFATMSVPSLVTSAVFGGVFLFAWIVLPCFLLPGGVLEFGFSKTRLLLARVASVIVATFFVLFLTSLMMLEPCAMFRFDSADCRAAIPAYLFLEHDIAYPFIVGHLVGVALLLTRIGLRPNNSKGSATVLKSG
jgi:hypothetical protein